MWQILRYMGYVKKEIAEDGQAVEGAIISLGNNKKIEQALRVTTNIYSYRYEVDFKLHREES